MAGDDMYLHLLYIIFAFFNLLNDTSGTFYPFVTCGSAVKLLNADHNVRLHSHEIKYGSGSGQQSVTGTNSQDDINSHWIIKGKVGTICNRGEPVKCGESIRLQHLSTNKNLHSHHFSSPLSSNQEVSAFGEKGEGDTGDNWTIICESDYWRRDENVKIKHVDTEAWLSVSGQSYGRPISGQIEVCAISYADSNSDWKTAEGIFIKPNEAFKTQVHQHTEL